MAAHRSSVARDFVITYIKGEGYLLKFWAIPVAVVDVVKGFENHFAQITYELEALSGFIRCDQIPIGLKCVVKSKIRNNMWCRAHVLRYQDYSSVLVQLLDYGHEEIVQVTDVRNINDPILSESAQAVECILADVVPAHGNEWSIEAIQFCEKHLLLQTLSCFVVSHYMKIPVVRVAKKGESEAFVQRLINGGLALIKQERASPPPQSLSYKMNSMDLNSVHLVRIACIENAQKFYVQLSAAEKELMKLMDAINTLPKETLPHLKVPAVNTPCLAPLSAKPCFYRALITYIQQNRCKVFFVDYGFSELKEIHELRAINPVFMKLAAQAICCSFPRDVSINPEELHPFIGFDHLQLNVLNRTPEAYIVRLFYQGRDIASTPPAPQNYIQQKLQPASKLEVIVSVVNSVNEFYFQLSNLKEQLNMVSNLLNGGYNFSQIALAECTPGKPVCVKFSEDNIWYRARVVKVNHESDIEVFFVDYGNFDNVNLSDVQKIGPELLKIPIQAFKGYLFEVNLPPNSKVMDEAFDMLEELTVDQALMAQVNVFTGDSGYGVTLYPKNSPTSVNEKVLSLVSIPIPTVPVSDLEDLYVTSFESGSSFFAQFEKLDSDKLANMQEEINSFYSGTQNTSYMPKEGKIVCARFNVDDQYYRAKVESCKDGFCNVYFIDYGNRESIPVKDVHSMDASFYKYPQFGIECALLNCPSHVSNDKLSSVILENSIKVKMVRKENEKWFVTINENCPENNAVLEVLRQSEKPAPRSILGTGLGGYQDRSLKSTGTHQTMTNHDDRTAHFNVNNNVVKSYNNEVYSLISIPSKAYRNVYVSHVESPSEFYCQIEEESSKLQLLTKTIEETYATEDDELILSKFVVDAPCCAVFEGAWYRGKIKKVNQQFCDVFFVDYGNSDAVSTSKIKKLRNDLFSWPAQALCCKSFNVSPKGNEWSNAEIDAFFDLIADKSFVAQFVDCDKNNVYAVNLVSLCKLQEEVFNKEFVNMGFGRLQDSNKTLILNSHAASTNLTFSSMTVQLGKSEAVEVTYGLNPGEIFCQLKSCAKNFQEMMAKFQSYYQKVTDAECLIDRPHPGMICAAQFHLDSAWYRAEIKKVEANKIYVFYVDYGNDEIVDRKKIRCIIQEFTELPVQAIKCRIRGIKPPGKTWTVNANLGKYFEGNAVCKFISKENDYFVVDMTCNQKDVAQLLISDRFAESDSTVAQTTESSFKRDNVEQPRMNRVVIPETRAPPQALHSIPSRKDNFVQGQLLSVTVSFIENPSKFWCQLLDESHVLDQLMEDIETQIAECSSVSETSLKVGLYSLAQYSEDDAWYRAQIKSCEPDNKYKVFFIDYGNYETVSQSQMKSLLPKMMEHPPQCFECSLLNTPSKLLPEMTTLFRDTIQEDDIEITAKIESVKSGVCIMTLLFDKDDQEINVNELLFGVKEQTSESGIHKDAPPQFLSPDVPLGLHDGYVSSVNTPQDFYIQLAGIEDTLADLSQELADFCENGSGVDEADLSVGYACASQYSEDNNCYRAEVIAIKDSTVDVLFVDYGNVDTVEKSVLKSLDDKHLQMKPLAIRCKMNGIVPTAAEWSEEAINTFQDMVLEECLGITFISKDIPASINITKNDKEISQCLVDAELANVETSAETDEAYAEDHLAPAPTEDPLSSLPSDQAYPERKLHSVKHVVKICYVDSYDKLYVTPSELRTELDTIMTTLEILYANTDNAESSDPKTNVPEALEDPKVSMPCVAKYSEDGAWYRALITEIEGESIYVFFVDYGNSEVTTLSNLRPLTPELVKIPPIALECGLFGIEAIEGQDQAITTKLEEYYLDEIELEMEICEFAPCKIRLYNNGEDIGSIFVKDGLAKEQPVIPDEIFAGGSLEYRIQISKRFFSDADKIVGNVKFCEVENDFIVFHVVSTDLEEDLQDLQQKLQDAYVEPPKNLTNVACMDFCATKYMEDENWYRAQVLSFDKEKVKVRFIDYGNCETVDKTDIYELLSDFTVEPQFSVKCVLFGLKVIKNKEVELQNKLDESVYHEPVELNLCKHSHALYDLCITSLVCGDTDIITALISEMLVSQQYVNGPLEDRFKAKVEKVTSDIVFLLPLKTIEEREAFQCKLQGVCNDLDISSEVLTYYLYGAKVEDVWYRVSVTNISDDEATVDLVDFGSNKVVSRTEFVILPVDICHQPVFLQQCSVKTFDDLTGNAKKLGIEELSVENVVVCETQKTYPIVHPFSIRILQIESELDDKAEKSVDDDALNKQSSEDIDVEKAKDIEKGVDINAEIISDKNASDIKKEIDDDQENADSEQEVDINAEVISEENTSDIKKEIDDQENADNEQELVSDRKDELDEHSSENINVEKANDIEEAVDIDTEHINEVNASDVKKEIDDDQENADNEQEIVSDGGNKLDEQSFEDINVEKANDIEREIDIDTEHINEENVNDIKKEIDDEQGNTDNEQEILSDAKDLDKQSSEDINVEKDNDIEKEVDIYTEDIDVGNANDIKKEIDDQEKADNEEVVCDGKDSQEGNIENCLEETIKTDEKYVAGSENVTKDQNEIVDDVDNIDDYAEKILNTDDKEILKEEILDTIGEVNAEHMDDCTQEVLQCNAGENITENIVNYDKEILDTNNKENIDKEEHLINDDKENMTENDMMDDNKENEEFVSSEVDITANQDEYNLDNMEVSGFVEPQFDDAEENKHKNLLEKNDAVSESELIKYFEEEKVSEKNNEDETIETSDNIKEEFYESLDYEPLEDSEYNDSNNIYENEQIHEKSNAEIKAIIETVCINDDVESSSENINTLENEAEIPAECHSIESDIKSSDISQMKEQNVEEISCTDDEKNNYSTSDFNVMENEMGDHVKFDEIQADCRSVESDMKSSDVSQTLEQNVEEISCTDDEKKNSTSDFKMMENEIGDHVKFDEIQAECHSVESDVKNSDVSQTLEQNVEEISCTDDEKNNTACDFNVTEKEIVDHVKFDEFAQENPSNEINTSVEFESKSENSEYFVDSSEEFDAENNRSIEDSYQLSGSVPVKISDIAISDGSVIFAVQPVYLEEEFLLLKQNINDCYSSENLPYNLDSKTKYCVVFHENEWCRGKVLQGTEENCTVMLIDYGKCVVVDNSNVKNLNSEHCNVSPFAVWCTLSSVVCPTEKSETAKTYLCERLKNTTAVVKILEGIEPYKINIFVDNSSVLNELLMNRLVTQKLPNMYLESGSYKAKLSFLNVNSETFQIFVNLSSFSDDYNALYESMQSTYKVEDFVANVVDSGIYAAFYNNSWYRGSVVSVSGEMQVYLVDTGETIADCNKLCFLLPEHCLQPAYAIPCRISCSDIKATNEISKSLNNVLKATEFLINIEACSDSNAISATLIDEQIVSEVKNMGLSQPRLDSDSCDNMNEESLGDTMMNSQNAETSAATSSTNERDQKTTEKFMSYLKETYTTELP